ncbi:hypothetical protein ACQ4LE_001510 [Meloidogyne hapla]
MDEAKVDSFVDFEKEEGNHFDKSETESSPNSTNNLVEQDEEEIMDKSNANNNSLMDDSRREELRTPINQGNMPKADGQHERDRTMDSTMLATNAADKRAEYYGGKLKWFKETRPVQKSVATYNRFRGSGETSDQTLDRLSNAVYSTDVGITYYAWRLLFGLMDKTSDIYAYAQTKGLTKPSVIALGVVLLPAVLVIMSPVLIGLTIVLVPTFFFGFIFFAIPSFCMAPFVLFLIYIFGGMPKLYSMINHLFNKIFGGGDNQIEENNNEDENDIPGTSQSN